MRTLKGWALPWLLLLGCKMPNPAFGEYTDSSVAETTQGSADTLASDTQATTIDPTTGGPTDPTSDATAPTTAPSTSEPTTIEPTTETGVVTDTDCLDRSCETETDTGVCEGPGCDAVPLWSRDYDAEEITLSGLDVDGAGNIVFAGLYRGTVNFGGDDLVNPAASRIFLVGLSPDGAHQWSKSFGESAYQEIIDLDVDPSGKIFITGGYHTSIDFGGGPNIGTPGGADVFVAALTAEGGHIWTKTVIGPNDQYGRAVVINDDVLTVAGVYESGLALPGNFPAPDLFNIFLARFDAGTGDVNEGKVTSWGSVNSEQDVSDLALAPDGDVIMVGSFAGDLFFDKALLAKQQGANKSDGYVVRIAPDNKIEWSFAIQGASGFVQVREVDVAGDGITIIGAADDELSIGDDPPIPISSTPSLYLLQRDHEGGPLWSLTTSGKGLAVGVDPSSGALVGAGESRGGVDYGGGVLQTSGYNDVCIFYLGGDGAHVWSDRFGGDNPMGVPEFGSRAVIDGQGLLYVGGAFTESIDFGVGEHVTGPGAQDIFIVKYGH
ncbi:MAG: hypothetical protein KC636_04350 [Myxococcales bacterium]|nr:hypothetical protein [Myxococcales bacterium]